MFLFTTHACSPIVAHYITFVCFITNLRIYAAVPTKSPPSATSTASSGSTCSTWCSTFTGFRCSSVFSSAFFLKEYNYDLLGPSLFSYHKKLLVNYLLLKRPQYWPPIDTSWPSIDIQLFLQQKCCDNSFLSSIWPLSGPLVTLIWALVSTNTLTMPKRMRGTSKTVRSVPTEQTHDHTVHTEWTYVHLVATV